VTAPRLRWVLPGIAVATVTMAAVLSTGPEAAGRRVYLQHCAACHGADLEGQPDWQARLPNGLLPAPPHDASGHTWHHSDALLLTIVRDGMAAVVPDANSGMPAFSDRLSDDQIRSVLAYIRSTWPARERAYQAERTRADAAAGAGAQ
jgi:mono/diheme cytochrome c family protein